MHSIHMRVMTARRIRALPSLIAAASLVGTSAGAAGTVQADQSVVVQGVVLDQDARPPRVPSFPSRYVDTVPHVTATRHEPPMSGQDDHVVEVAAIDAQGHYSLTLSPGVWELDVERVDTAIQPQIPTVDTRETAGPVVQDLAIDQVDATLSGTVTGDGLDVQHPAHAAVELWSGNQFVSKGGSVSGWLTSGSYQAHVAPCTWLRGQAVQSNDGGYEERLDARAPFVVGAGASTLDWSLPSFSFDDPVCELPHTCSLTAHGSGWLPDVPVAIYLVSQTEFPNGRPSGWLPGAPAIPSPEDADRWAQEIVTRVQPDASGGFDGPVGGEAEVIVASIDTHQVSSFAAVQRAPGVFKMAQPTTGFSLPAFDPLVLLNRSTPVVPSDSGEAAPETPADGSDSQP